MLSKCVGCHSEPVEERSAKANFAILRLAEGCSVVATDIATGINELICGKPEEMTEEDKMNGSLKSWF